MAEIKVSVCDAQNKSLGGWKITDPVSDPLRSAENLVTALKNVSEFASSFPPMGRNIKLKVIKTQVGG